MNSQILRSKIKEQVENKINPILKEKYQENIALKLFRASIEIIRDSVDRITEMYYIYYPQQEKENFVKEVELHVFEWKVNDLTLLYLPHLIFLGFYFSIQRRVILLL